MSETIIPINGCVIVDKKAKKNRYCLFMNSSDFGEYCKFYKKDISDFSIFDNKKPEWCKIANILVKEEK